MLIQEVESTLTEVAIFRNSNKISLKSVAVVHLAFRSVFAKLVKAEIPSKKAVVV